MALSLQQEQQASDLGWEQIPEGISDLELAKKLQEEEDRRASQYYQEQEQAQAEAAAAAQAQVSYHDKLAFKILIYTHTVRPKCIQKHSTFLTLSQFIRNSLENGSSRVHELQTRVIIMTVRLSHK